MELSCTAPATSGSRTARTRQIIEPTDAIIRLTATCICGSDLWPYRGAEPVDRPRRWATSTSASSRRSAPTCGRVKVGDFVVGSFFASDNTCEICRAGYQTHCVHRRPMARPSAPRPSCARIPLADGTLVATPGHARRRPDPVAAGRLRRARHRLVRRRRRRGRPRQDRRGRRRRRGRAARRSSPPSSSAPSGSSRCRRHADRQALAREFGATDIVEERGDDGRRQDQGAHRRARRPLGHRGRRHPGVDDAGHPLHPPRRPRRLRRRLPRRRRSPATSCSSPACTCTAAPPRCAGSCPS